MQKEIDKFLKINYEIVKNKEISVEISEFHQKLKTKIENYIKRITKYETFYIQNKFIEKVLNDLMSELLQIAMKELYTRIVHPILGDFILEIINVIGIESFHEFLQIDIDENFSYEKCIIDLGYSMFGDGVSVFAGVGVTAFNGASAKAILADLTARRIGMILGACFISKTFFAIKQSNGNMKKRFL